MRILLDECIDESLRHCFAQHECQTCRFAGFKGFANGRLISAAEKAGFQVLITVDQNLPRQQNLKGRSLSIVVLTGRTTEIDELMALVPAVLAALETLGPGQVLCIEHQ
jgi:predicted nuclease of predicted toxin-antitoxin system